MTVSDEESFKKIPDVPGLVSYRVDNKKLYVNQGTKWQALSSEQEVSLNKKKNIVARILYENEFTFASCCATNHIYATYL